MSMGSNPILVKSLFSFFFFFNVPHHSCEEGLIPCAVDTFRTGHFSGILYQPEATRATKWPVSTAEGIIGWWCCHTNFLSATPIIFPFGVKISDGGAATPTSFPPHPCSGESTSMPPIIRQCPRAQLNYSFN